MEIPSEKSKTTHSHSEHPNDDVEASQHEKPIVKLDMMQMDEERAPEARGKVLDEVPNSYWYSPGFIGTVVAEVLAVNAGIGGFTLVSPLLSIINNEIGPSTSVTWISLSYILCQGIGSLVTGRLSDVFGRRWIFISGSAIGLVGAILGSQARSIDQLIGATTLLGIAGGIQVNYWWVVSEIVPMRFRYLASGGFIALCPYSHLSSKIAFSMQNQTSVGWRGIYYLVAATEAASILAWYWFYHPPTFKMLHRQKRITQLLISFDWIGLFVYIASTVSFLLGIQWGGGLYPWKSAQVIGTLLAGVAGFVIFILWELYISRNSSTTLPFVQLHYLQNFQFMAGTMMSAVGASAFYGFGIIWPSAVSTIYTGLSDSKKGTLLGLSTMCYLYGQTSMTSLAHWFGPKPVLIVTMMVAGPITAAAAYNPLNMNMTMAFIIVGSLFIGAMEGVALVTVTFPLRTQEDIGTAGGLSGSIRVFLSSVAVAIYSTTLTNRLALTIPANVIPAATAAGLPSSSISSLLSALSGATALDETNVPGLTAQIIDVASLAYRLANSQAYSTVFLVSLAFTGPGMILCWFVAQNDRTQGDFVAGHIHKAKDEKVLEEQ